MCQGNLIELTYNYRSDVKLDTICDKVYNQVRQENPFKPITEKRMVNICFHRETREKINKECKAHFGIGKERDALDMFAGIPVICTRNKHGFSNGDRYFYKSSNETHVILQEPGESKTEVKMEVHTFKYLFEPAYCTTVHSSQCITIREPFNVYEVDKFSNRMAYTCFTRATSMDLIHVDTWPEQKGFGRDWQNSKIIDLTTDSIKHVIYSLSYGSDIFYVGQTNNTIRRKQEHLEASQD